MPFQSLKLLLHLIVAALEVTLLHLGVSLLALVFEQESSLSWPALMLVCLAGAWTMARLDPLRDEDGALQWRTIAVCALPLAYAVKVQAGGGWNPLNGWSLLWPFAAGSPDSLTLVALLIACLWCWWRGMALVDADHAHVLGVLQRGILALVFVTLVITPVSPVNLGAPPWGARLATQALAIAALGLLGLSLARIIDEAEAGQIGGGWYWLRSSLLTSLGVLLVGMLLLTLVSDSATLALRSVLAVIFGILGLLLLPFIWLIAQVGEWLLSFLNPLPAEQVASPSPSPIPDALQQAPSAWQVQIVQTIQLLLTILLYLLPLVILLLLIITMQQRRKQRHTADGVLRESLWSWQRLGADLRDLLKNLRLPTRAQGLRDALARLRRDDPAQRIRRRYVELLLLGEAAELPRQPQQTPLEYAPVFRPVAPSAASDLQALTDAYDKARYAPNTITAADAAAADAAWTAIQAQAPKENH